MRGTIAFKFVAIALLAISAHFVSAGEDDLWDEFDEDKSGTVNEAELKAGFQKKGITINDDQAKEIMHVGDFNNDGTLQKVEFNCKVVHYIKFKAFDKDNNGYITKDELKPGFQKDNIQLTTAMQDEIFKVADENHDGKINYREYLYNVHPYFKFVVFDVDKVGFITKAELKDGFAKHSVTVNDETLEHVFQVGDRNNDHHISYTEYVHRIEPFYVFDKLDKDDDGSIHATELKDGLAPYSIILTDAKAKELILIADLNDDGTVIYREFLHEIWPFFRFIKLDTDKSGQLTKQELGDGLKLYGINLDDSRLTELHKLGDTNGDDHISYAEYVRKIDAIFVFRRFDKNGNGLLDKNELKEGFELHGLTLDQAQLDMLFTVSDSIKKDGHINYEEFVRKTFPYFVFRKFDANKSGSISMVELKEGMSHHGIAMDDSRLTELWNTANKKSDDFITYDEFVDVIEPFFRFRRLDKNKCGEIDASELAERSGPLFGKKFTMAEAQTLINSVDEGGKNGKLDLKEYLKIDSKIV